MKRLLLTMLVGVPLFVACAAPVEDAESSGDAISQKGCPKKPSCDDRDDEGELCLPPCTEACRTKHADASLWVSPYEVAGTFDLGRHQGLAIVGVEYEFDARASLRSLGKADAKRYAWPISFDVTELPVDMARTIFMRESGHEHMDFAFCDKPTVVMDRALANHGRALSRDPRDAQSRMRLEHGVVDVKPTKASSSAKSSAKDSTKVESVIDRVEACLAKISNGFCDSVCGNCSYVLPNAATLTSASGDWSEPSDLIAGTGNGCSTESYYGRPNARSQEDIFGSRYPNPFTHCAMLGCDPDTEAPSVKSLISSAPVSGLYGHNSNTDAEAEYLAFKACISGATDVTSACSACGKTTTTNQQTPCLARTNTAANFWTRTATPGIAGRFTDLVPPVRRADAGESLNPPMCAWGGFSVNGM